jgi:hypothetical protein
MPNTLDFLDTLLRRLFIKQVSGITDAAQVRFRAPDHDWRTYVSGLNVGGHPAPALNVYLVDLRENRRLRSNERARVIDRGVPIDTPAPRWADCHYLITAWSPATEHGDVEPLLAEHRLLYDVTAALMRFQPLMPAVIFDPDLPPAGLPAHALSEGLATTVLPADGFPKYAEFWGTMGNIHPWKPAVYLVVTVPVEMPVAQAGKPVTMRTTVYTGNGDREVFVQIGGTVRDPAGAPVTGAWVQIQALDEVGAPKGPAATTRTDALGRFTFANLKHGNYTLAARASGLGDFSNNTLVISADSGNFDITMPAA